MVFSSQVSSVFNTRKVGALSVLCEPAAIFPPIVDIFLTRGFAKRVKATDSIGILSITTIDFSN